MICEHYFCRCARADELAAQGNTIEAIRVHDEKVTCRLVEIVWSESETIPYQELPESLRNLKVEKMWAPEDEDG